jgi:hypothetical protein
MKSKYENFDKLKQKAELLKAKYSTIQQKMDKRDSFGKNVINRDYLVDMNLDTDLNERLIGDNLRQIGKNLEDTGISLKQQGDTLRGGRDKVRQTGDQVRVANLRITELSSGQRCQLILLNLIAVLLFLFIVVIFVLKFLNSKA